MSQVDSKRFRIWETDNIGLDLEYNNRLAIVHLPYVNKFTKSTFICLYDKLRELQEMIDIFGLDGIYAGVGEDDKKIQKLVNMLGFTYVGSNLNYKVYKCLN